MKAHPVLIPNSLSRYPSVITWSGRQVLMNDYEDAEFFTGAFPTLFPYGKGGHMLASDERGIAVSLEAWGEWLMKHRSRR